MLLYAGIITQAASKMTNLLCIPRENPSPSHQYVATPPTSHITKMEPFLYTDLQGIVDAVPCARCYTSSQTMEIILPGSKTCPVGWTKLYHGHLVTSFELSTTDILCADEQLTTNILWGTGSTTTTSNDLNLLETDCGEGGVVTSCQGYQKGQIMPCVSCSK